MQCQTPGTNRLPRVPEPGLGCGQREISRQRCMGHAVGPEGKPSGMVLRSQPLSLQPGSGDGGQCAGFKQSAGLLSAGSDRFLQQYGRKAVGLHVERTLSRSIIRLPYSMLCIHLKKCYTKPVNKIQNLKLVSNQALWKD